MSTRESWFSSPLLWAYPRELVSVSPTGSPFTYSAPLSGSVVVSGGVVTQIELGRSGSFVTVGLLAGIVPVSAGDSVRVTYSSDPTITYFPS